MLLQYLKKFEPVLADGSKIHTMREHRIQHPPVGSQMHEYIGLRTKNCRLIRNDRQLCGWQEVRIFYSQKKASIYIDGHRLTDDAMALLAYNDGFRGTRKSIVGHMLKHFGIEYPGQKWMGQLFHATNFRYHPGLDYSYLVDQLFQLSIPFKT
jgi:hypothetical protein